MSEVNQRWQCHPVVALVDVEDWHRQDDQFYIARAQLVLSDGSVLNVLGRAFVSYGPTPTQQQIAWENRRAELAAAGIQVPELLAEYSGMSIEQWVGDDLDDTARISEVQALGLGQILTQLQRLDLFPREFPAGCKWSGSTVFLVDLSLSSGIPSFSWRDIDQRMKLQLPSRVFAEFQRGRSLQD